MKKLLTIALALILAVFMTMSICAADTSPVEDLDPTETDNNSATAEVNIKIAGKENITTVYSVDVAWDSLDFTYNFGDADIWNPDTHEYETGATGTAGSWTDNSADIVVTNHSNAKIRATASFAGGSTSLSRNDVTATLSNPSFTVETAVGTAVDSAPNGKFTCTVSGIPSGTSDFNLGTITIKIETVSSGT